MCYKMQNMQRDELYMNVVKKLELYRLENRITLQELANDLGVAFSTVSRWLNGKTKPNKIQLYHIEKLLKERFGHDKQE